MDFLSDVQRIAARYKVLHFFRWLPSIHGVAGLETRFRQCVPLPNSYAEDFFPNVFATIEVLRVLQSPSARELLQTATYQHGELFGGLRLGVADRIVDLAGRLDADLPSVDAISDSARRSGGELRVVTLVQAVTAYLDKGDLRGATKLAAEIGEEFPDELSGAHLHAMHYINRMRLLSNQRPKSAQELSRNAATTLRSLGQEANARRVLAGAAAGEVEGMKVKKNRIVISLKGVPVPRDAPSRLRAHFSNRYPRQFVPYGRLCLNRRILCRRCN